MICCRYMDFKYWLCAIERGQFKVSKPSDFEDGYDSAAYAAGEISRDVIERFSNSAMDVLRSHNLRDALQSSGITSSDVYEQRQKSFRGYFDHFFLRRAAVDEYLRVLCFFDDDNATEKDRYEMWERYGGAFSGVRVFVDLDKFIGGEYKKVKYADTIPCCDLSKIDELPMCQYLERFYKDMVFTKVRGRWGFENEVRYILSVTKCRQNKILYSEAGLDFISVPLDALVGVDFGCEAKAEAYMPDVRRLANSVLHHVSFRAMTARGGDVAAYEDIV